MSEILTKDNWRQTVLTELEESEEWSEHMGVHIGHHQRSEECVAITIGHADPPHVVFREILVRWWNTRREQLEFAIRHIPYSNMKLLLQSGSQDTLNKPCISIGDDDENVLYPGEAKVKDLTDLVGFAIVNF